MLKSHKYTKMEKCLVVCPLNTVLNWVNEFEIWLTDVDFEIEVRLELCYDKTCLLGFPIRSDTNRVVQRQMSRDLKF